VVKIALQECAKANKALETLLFNAHKSIADTARENNILRSKGNADFGLVD
jgi:hypothetical protein